MGVGRGAKRSLAAQREGRHEHIAQDFQLAHSRSLRGGGVWFYSPCRWPAGSLPVVDMRDPIQLVLDRIAARGAEIGNQLVG